MEPLWLGRKSPIRSDPGDVNARARLCQAPGPAPGSATHLLPVCCGPSAPRRCPVSRRSEQRGDPSGTGEATRSHVPCRGHDPACLAAIPGAAWPRPRPSWPSAHQALRDGARDAGEEPRGVGRPRADPTAEGRRGLRQCPLRSVHYVRQGPAPRPPLPHVTRPTPTPRRCGPRQHLQERGRPGLGLRFANPKPSGWSGQSTWGSG